ncbi:unnamed protein product [Caenorhabditis angaria]|uniref:Uncharacterized protein n=1 Tax=Caenorhabditis angaria TaxID=860376 RepID=A0A9P1MVV3_9PELO|nr:unnamed protein product [Caenorhabditis angaria]
MVGCMDLVYDRRDNSSQFTLRIVNIRFIETCDAPEPPSTSTRHFIPQHLISSQILPEYIEWPNAGQEIEYQQQQNEEEEGTSSSQVSETLFESIARRIRESFPTDFEMITVSIIDLVLSMKSDDILQGEIFDILGFDHFELASEILEKRNAITTEKK